MAALVLVGLVLVLLVAALAVGVLGTALLVGLGGLGWWASRSATRVLHAWRDRPVDEGRGHVLPATFEPSRSYV